jgi:AraC-like DNA-binding protein
VNDIHSVRNARPSFRLVRICTDDWPERERFAMFRELHGRDRIRVEPRPDEPLRIDVTLAVFPTLGLLWGRRSPLRSEFADGSDRLILNLGGPSVATQFGRDIALERGDAIALSGSESGTVTTMRAGRIATLEFPMGGLLPSPKRSRPAWTRRIARDSLPLTLLRGYLNAACASDEIVNSGLPPVVIAHFHDLAAMAIGAGREAEEIANGRGVRAARLRAIKQDILTLVEHEVSLSEIAARHQLSPRYIGMLFEGDGTCFTEFVREQRLKRARSILLNPCSAGRRIAEIAYEVGFNDLSYFNRSFRRRFGESPSEMREHGLDALDRQ